MTLQDEVHEFVDTAWRGADDPAYRRRVFAAGWAAPGWPRDAYGRGLPAAEARRVPALFAAAGAPDPVRSTRGYGALMGTPVLREGSPELREAVLPKLLTGEWHTGCLLYSEPGNGSDLAGVQTRAVRDGDDFVVTGHKIWTTEAHLAQAALLLARTNPDVPKHAGLTLFVLDMATPGIEVCPIRQITGEQDFNEVFLTEVRVPARNAIGPVDDGWRVLQIALAEERRLMGLALGVRPKRPGERPRIFTASDDLVAAARAAGRLDDEAVRQQLMRIHSWRMVNRWTGQRALAELRRSGSSSLASIGKLEKSRILHEGWGLRFRLQGAQSLRYDYDDPAASEVGHQLMWSFINSIGGGSDQIQRNIIAERILGLPKGHEPDRDVPFRDIVKGGMLHPRAEEDRA
ncbi:acyl-CoA dehydrogenase family protein [Microbacterium sp. GXF7504]